MRETDALVRVQEIDLALMRYKRTLGDMPQTKKLHAIRAARKKVASQLSKIVGQRKDLQMDLEENERAHARLEEIVEETQLRFEEGETGYRELANLESQLTSLAKKLEKREFQRKELLARLDKVQTAERNARAMDARLEEEAQAQTRSYKEQTANIERDVRMLVHEREQVVASISEDVLKRYDAAVRRFGGLAVETLTGNKPSVCRVSIPPSSFGDIRRGPDITECPYCHRLLVCDHMFSS
ncbi:MAG: C4-type zinc ribbon domain-containing protein [Coriobacteriales bacterium]|nr:C4-type zinc ribbon domain-containing protein [Coriobacteriales bacterium]